MTQAPTWRWCAAASGAGARGEKLRGRGMLWLFVSCVFTVLNGFNYVFSSFVIILSSFLGQISPDFTTVAQEKLQKLPPRPRGASGRQGNEPFPVDFLDEAGLLGISQHRFYMGCSQGITKVLLRSFYGYLLD